MPRYVIFVGAIIVLLLLLIPAYNKFYNTLVTYKGITPCADCPGIEETVTFYKDMTYSDKNVYLERNTSYIDKGKWSVTTGAKSNPNATVYQLTREDGKKSYFLLGGNQIKPLDSDLNELPAPYNAVLTKQP